MRRRAKNVRTAYLESGRTEKMLRGVRRERQKMVKRMWKTMRTEYMKPCRRE